MYIYSLYGEYIPSSSQVILYLLCDTLRDPQHRGDTALSQKGTEHGNSAIKVQNSPTTGVKTFHKTTNSTFYMLSYNLTLTGNYLQNHTPETTPAQVTTAHG